MLSSSIELKCTTLQKKKKKYQRIEVSGYAVLLTAFCFATSPVDFNIEQLLVWEAIEDGITKILYLWYFGFSASEC